MDIDWLDVGSWPAYGSTLEADADGNKTAGARLTAVDSKNNLVASDDPDHTVALLGCDDLIVVRTPSATLVMPKERAQDLKKIHAELPDELK